MKTIGLGTIILALTFYSCGTKTTELRTNKQLKSFKSQTVMTMDDLVDVGGAIRMELYSKNFNPRTDTIKFGDSLIYVSYLKIVNGCASYAGDIEIKSDSIFLKLVEIGDVVCTEQRCDRLIYEIRNYGHKDFKIVKR